MRKLGRLLELTLLLLTRLITISSQPNCFEVVLFFGCGCCCCVVIVGHVDVVFVVIVILDVDVVV